MAQRTLAQEVFQHFPHGIIVFDRSGQLIGANRAAAGLLGPMGRTAGGYPSRCCELLGCRTEGVLEGVCLAELAAEASGPLPEVRVDLPSSASADAVWISIAPLGVDLGRFLVEARPAEAHDRRRRTQPHWMGKACLRVFALGRTRLESREGPIEGKWLEQRAGQLFKYLLCERRRVVYPDEVAEAIWPNEGGHVLGTVRYFVHRLRRHLEPEAPKHGPSSFIIAAEGGYRLAPSVQIDADDFEKRVLSGLDAEADGEPARAAEQLEHAMALYRGDLIADLPHAPWVFDERERLRTLAEQALRYLLQHALEQEDREAPLAHLRALVQLQPFDLNLHRQLLSQCLKCGRRSEAMRRYTALRARLREEFREELDFELSDLSLRGRYGRELPS